MKNMILSIAVMLLAVISISCEETVLPQDANSVDPKNLKELVVTSDDDIPSWVREKVTPEECKTLETLSNGYRIDYSFMAEGFYESAREDIYKKLEKKCEDINNVTRSFSDKGDLFIIPRSDNFVAPRISGGKSRTETIFEKNGVYIACSFTFVYDTDIECIILEVSSKRFFAGPVKNEASIEGEGLVGFDSKEHVFNIIWSGRLAWKDNGGEYRELWPVCNTQVPFDL